MYKAFCKAMVATNILPIHRVVTTFILTRAPPSSPTTTDTQQSPHVAIFHRCDTMPTFPSHWAGISGTIEDGETPYEAAQRELSEETNVTEIVQEQGGLYVDVLYESPRSQKERIIRVYPFIVNVPPEVSSNLELRGTEHDRFQLVTVEQLEEMQSECVPGLVQAFHHATYGVYDTTISPVVRAWASDVENGASVMTANALKLLLNNQSKDDWRAAASQIAMLRPSMVPICNVMRMVLDNGKDTVTAESFQKAIQESVELGIQSIKVLVEASNKRLTVATFSRSGTLRQVLSPFKGQVNIVCGQSSPGNEGELMAQDLGADSTCISDEELKSWLSSGKIDLLIVGSDCILPEANQMVNKVGTLELCQIAQKRQVPVFCCADRWKVWDDKFPPPLERDLFELVPLDLITKLLVPKECS